MDRPVTRARKIAPRCLAGVALLLLAIPAPGPVAREVTAASRLADRATGATPMLDDLRELCDRIGGRLTGTPACERAVEWAAAKFREAGLDSVAVEPYEVPFRWLPGPAEGEVLSPETFPLRLVAAPNSSPTARPLEAPLVDAGQGSPEQIRRLGDAARGAVALVSTDPMTSLGDLFAEYMRDAPMLAAAHEAGIAGILLMSNRPRSLLYRHPVTIGGEIEPLPVALVAREPAQRLRRLLDGSEEVRVRLSLSGRTGGPYESHNVVAEIRGQEHPEEIVLVGAHLDSYDLGTGAQDNGVNCALLIDMARGIRALGFVPRRTIRFALFTGEEQGMWGSAGYVKRHAAELDNHVAVVILDIGSGAITGFYLNGREELRGPVEAALSAVPDLGHFDHSIEAIDGTDNFDFLLSGVPNLVGEQEAAEYLPDYHAESDVYEMVNTQQAKKNEAITSVMVWGLANSPVRTAGRQKPAEVDELIKEQGLESIMKSFGQWEAWAAGRRGVRN